MAIESGATRDHRADNNVAQPFETDIIVTSRGTFPFYLAG
jgi:hypothetical protein